MKRRLARLVLIGVVLLGGTASGSAADARCVVASPADGPAPLEVTFTSTCAGASWHWDFGDGVGADTRTVAHIYAGGTWTATLTVTQADGSQTTGTAVVTAEGIVLVGPRRGDFGRRAAFRGKVVSEGAGAAVTLTAAGRPVARAAVTADGRFAVSTRLRVPGPYRVTSGSLVSNATNLLLRPRLELRIDGKAALGEHATLRASVTPASAGVVTLQTRRNDAAPARVRRAGSASASLDTALPGSYHVRAQLTPAPGWLPVHTTRTYTLAAPQLTLGSSGAAVRALEQRLLAQRYALSRTDTVFGEDTLDAVYAFQKVHDLPRTGSVDARLWTELARADVPGAQVTGDAIEVNKTRQVLYVVRHGETQLVVPVSTGATGNTPLGEFHVYRKVPGFDWVLYFPSYFLRGFAVHGYPSVPPYPASHGCVRIPMWVAQRVYGLIPPGSRIVVHL